MEIKEDRKNAVKWMAASILSLATLPAIAGCNDSQDKTSRSTRKNTPSSRVHNSNDLETLQDQQLSDFVKELNLSPTDTNYEAGVLLNIDTKCEEFIPNFSSNSEFSIEDSIIDSTQELKLQGK